MATPAEWRERARSALHSVGKESATNLKQLLASHALAMACLAEKIERETIERIAELESSSDAGAVSSRQQVRRDRAGLLPF